MNEGGADQPARGDRGSGTLLVVAVIAFAGLLIAVTLAAGQAMTVRHRARAAADLAALAAAGALEEGSSGACAAAAEVAVANRAVLTACSLGPSGEVTITVDSAVGKSLLVGLPPATSSARAGPSVP